jgi:beta-mannosidase
MQKIRLSLIVICFLCSINIYAQKNANRVINLNDSWQFKSLNDSEWKNAKIPGSIHTDLFNNQLIPDPFKSNIEKELTWIDTTTWIYKKVFTIPKQLKHNDHISIFFYGLDTYADVYLNDLIIISANNMFIPWEIEINSKILKRKNELKIIFHPTKKHETEIYSRLNYKLPEGSRSITRKAAFQYGWDWAPKYLGCGIWTNVELHIWQSTNFTNISYSIKELNNAKAKIELNTEIQASENFNGEINLNDAKNGIHISQEIKIKKGTHNYLINFEIDNPQLWWTHNLGTPYLYNFNIDLINQQKLIHTQNINIGIREIELVQEKDSLGRSFFFKLNNIPVYMKGANYVPQSSFPGSLEKEKYINLISDVKFANMNMLRVWGGGIYEKDIFYDLCDKEGILVWQDFMFANTMFPNNSLFLENIKQEARYQTQRLRKHPCIALWCGNNEIDEAWHNWGWSRNYSKEDSTLLWDNYKNIFHEILPNIVKEFSPKTSYSSSSPLFGRGNPKSENEGDNHYWYVWHDEYDFNWYNKVTGRFMSEFGFQSYPNIETINYFYPSSNKSMDSEIIAAHQKHSKGNHLINYYMEDYYPIPSDFQQFIYTSQLLQAQGIRTGILAQRRAKPFCMGSLYWQLNDCWPAISWSSIDFLGNWKALHYFAKQDYKNVILSPIIENQKLKIYAISDSISIQNINLTISLIDFYGNSIHKETIQTSLNRFNSNLIFEKNIIGLLKNHSPKQHALVISLGDKNKSYDQRVVYFEKPKDLELHKININFRFKSIENGYQLILKSTTLIKNLQCELPVEGFWNDNYFDLIPGNEKIITFKTNEKIKNIESQLKFTSLNQILNK